MNISGIMGFRFASPINQNVQNNKRISGFGLKMSEPLSRDTVSFQNNYNSVSFKSASLEKFLSTKSGGVSKATAKSIHEIAEGTQPYVEAFMRNVFEPYITTPTKPNNLISYISGRPKSADSILEKSKILQENTKAGILVKMTDLNGVKIVLTDGSRKNVHKLLDIIQSAIEKGIVRLEEVEVKRPKAADKLKGKCKSKWDYAEPEYIQQFVSNAENSMGRKVEYQDPSLVPGTKANYCAIHMLMRLPGQKRVFEVQIMGPSVAKFKTLDDLLYKILNNKNVDKKYNPIVKILSPLIMTKEDKTLAKYIKLREKMDKLKFSQQDYEQMVSRVAGNYKLIMNNDTPEYMAKIKSLLHSKDVTKEDLPILVECAKLEADYQDKEFVKKFKDKVAKHEVFTKYRADAFLFQRGRQPITYADDNHEYFLPLSVNLPGEFDLNSLYRIMLKCDETAGKVKKKL